MRSTFYLRFACANKQPTAKTEGSHLNQLLFPMHAARFFARRTVVGAS
jgi:hypothetical protein